MFSHKNAFSRLSERIFSYDVGAKKILNNYSIHYNKDSIITQFTSKFKLLFRIHASKVVIKGFVVFGSPIDVALLII